MKRTLVVTAALSLIGSIGAAQQTSDKKSIEQAVASYVASHTGLRGVVVFDGTLAASSREAAQIDSLAMKIRATKTGKTADYYRCEDKHPSTCKIVGVDAIVSIGAPEISGDSAIVTVMVRRVRRRQEITFTNADESCSSTRRGSGRVAS